MNSHARFEGREEREPGTWKLLSNDTWHSVILKLLVWFEFAEDLFEGCLLSKRKCPNSGNCSLLIACATSELKKKYSRYTGFSSDAAQAICSVPQASFGSQFSYRFQGCNSTNCFLAEKEGNVFPNNGYSVAFHWQFSTQWAWSAVLIASVLWNAVRLDGSYRFQSSVYKLYAGTRRTWAQAKDYCVFLGGNLVSVNSELESKFLQQTMASRVNFNPLEGSWLILFMSRSGLNAQPLN